MTETEGHARQHPTLTLGVLSLSAFAYILLQSMVLPALPEIGKALHTSQSTVAWVLTAYLVSASVATPVLGRLGDMFGKKKVLVAVLVFLVAGSVLAALTSSIAIMLIARVIQGAGGAIFPLAFSIVRDEFPRERVAGAIGMLSALIGVGAGIAIVRRRPDRRQPLDPLAVLDPRGPHGRRPRGDDLLGSRVADHRARPHQPGRGRHALGLADRPAARRQRGREWGWTSARVLGLFVLAVVLFVAWIVTEQRAEQPLVDVRMMRIPSVWWTNISAMLFGFGMYSVMIVVPSYLQTPSSNGYGFGASITKSGLALLPLSGAMLVAGILTGRFSTRFGSKVPLVVGSAFSALGMLFLAVAHDGEWNFYVGMALVGLGIGFAFSAMSNLVVEAVPASQTGVATGMNANVRTIGGAIGSQIVASVIAGTIVGGALPTEHGYELVVHRARGRARRRRCRRLARPVAARRAIEGPSEGTSSTSSRASRASSRPPTPASRSASGSDERPADRRGAEPQARARGSGRRARAAWLGARHAGRRTPGRRGHRHRLPALPVAPGADRGDRPPVLRARRSRLATTVEREVRRGGSLRAVRARASRACWPTTACSGSACGTRRRPSPCGPSCACSSASSSTRPGATGCCARTSRRRTRSRCSGRSRRWWRPRTSRSGSATSTCVLDSLRGQPPRNLLAPPIDREQWDAFVRSAYTAAEA